MIDFFSNKTKKRLKWLGFFCLASLFLFLLTEKINLITADLGRHLANGETFLFSEKRSALLKTNFYSYTNPDFPFINHHWGSGVIFYLIWLKSGFIGVHLFFLGIALVTLGIFFLLAKEKAGYFWTILVAFLILPLLAERREVRPEIFSCFLGGVFFYLLWTARKKQLSSFWLWLIPFLEIIWVNLHIAFFLGLLILGIFLFQSIIDGWRYQEFSFFKKLLKISLFTSLATLINPNGISGAIYPLKIFQNFGYDLAENKPIWFLENYGIENPNFFLLKIVLFLLAVSFLGIILKKRSIFSWIDFLLAVLFSIMALAAWRNMSLATFFFWPILATNFRKIFSLPLKIDLELLSAGIVGYMGLFLWLYVFVFAQTNHTRGLGLQEGVLSSANFFQEQKITGPIFNNYDIGGYLIFHFKNQEKVFVDNRPEAYPEKFFKEIYIPAQEDPEKWRKLNDQYNFNCVFFYRHDLTPWGQKFLISLVDNPDWVPVFVDNYTIIFLKKNEENQPIIDKFKLPREIFAVQQAF